MAAQLTRASADTQWTPAARASAVAASAPPARATSLPTLALSQFDAGVSERRAFIAALRQAASEFGFFYLTRHGVPRGLNELVFEQSRAFFALPDAEKAEIAMIKSPHFRGYTRAGFEYTAGAPDWREQLDIGAERAALDGDADAPAYTRLQGPNQWPASLPDFALITLEWQRQVTAVLMRLLGAFALALEQDEDVFAPLHGHAPHQLVKLIRYPGQAQPEGAQGVGAHKDGGLLSLILQDGAGGLQVEVSPGVWIEAAPRPDSFVVNIGELLELASDGLLRATVHRVVSPAAGGERLSAAFFLGAQLDATVRTLALPPHLASQASGVARDPDNPLFRQAGQNTLKSRLRSHPDVAQRHHADLLSA